ncbi:hypothetical protein ACFE04_016884 [Oxalis oulophora]
MSDSVSNSSSESVSVTTADQNGVRSIRISDNIPALAPESRHWRDIFWLGIFLSHLVVAGFFLVILGLNRFKKTDRLNIDRYTNGFLDNHNGLTENYWSKYAVAGGIGTILGWTWLLLLGSYANLMLKVSVHVLTTYLAVISVLCFWCEQFFWGVAFAIGAVLQFLYVMLVSSTDIESGSFIDSHWLISLDLELLGPVPFINPHWSCTLTLYAQTDPSFHNRLLFDRIPFTMLMLQKSVKMVSTLPEVRRVSYAFMTVMLLWMALWSFGAAGIVASSFGDGGRWWLLVVFSVSLFWTGAVLCNTVHVIVSGMVFLVLIHGGRDCSSMPSKPLVKSLRYAVTTSFGSICYGSLFTAAIRTLRWEIRGMRSKIGNNECLLCCIDFLFHLVETLVRFFNKYAYVQIGVHGKGFNRSARDAWELFQSTGVESLIAYDCSGAVLLMGTILGGLITGTCAASWTWVTYKDRVVMVGSTAMLMGMILYGVAHSGIGNPKKSNRKRKFLLQVGLAMVVVESAVTSIYICYAEDPLLIHRWDAEFFNQLSETLHQRLQHRSSRATEVFSLNHPDNTVRDTLAI